MKDMSLKLNQSNFYVFVVHTACTTCLNLELSSYSCLYLSLQDGDTALHMSSMNGHLNIVRLLLDAGSRDGPDKVGCKSNIFVH